jgi:hypothetical protein
MTTEKQIQANRVNAQKAGVKTPEGKAISRLNAMTHGLLSKEALLPGENEEWFNSLRTKYMNELQPVGELETFLVERIISSTWRLKRILQTEKKYSHNCSLDENNPEIVTRLVDYRNDSWQNAMRYETSLERQIYKAVKELERIQKIRADLESETVPELDAEVAGDGHLPAENNLKP